MIMSLILYKKFSSCRWCISQPKLYEDKSKPLREGGAFLSIALGNGDGTYDIDNACCVYFSADEVALIIHAIDTNFENYALNEKNPCQFNTYHDHNGDGTGIIIGRNKDKESFYIIALSKKGKTLKYYPDGMELYKIKMYLSSLYSFMFVWDGEIIKKT